jgi:urease accessory protein
MRAGAPSRIAAGGLERAEGRLLLSVDRRGGRHAVADLAQVGCARLLFPNRSADDALEAVMVNVGGGLTGGDRYDVRVEVGSGAAATLTTQACEKIYAAASGPARVSAELSLASGARLDWLPQETILFEKARLERTLAVDMAEDASMLVVEAVLLGRLAMGEILSAARLRDSWRIRRGGRLVFAEEAAAGGPAGWERLRASPALLGGAAALATIVHVAPGAAKALDEARAIVESSMAQGSGLDGGASAFDGLLVLRLAAPSGLALRRVVTPLIDLLRGGPPPRVWMT